MFGWNDIHHPLPLSVIDFSTSSSMWGATSSPAQSVLGCSSPENRYQKAGEESIDLWIMSMEDDHLVDIAEKWKRPPVLKLLTTNSNTSQLCDQLVRWTTQQYNPATYS
jgi:hypothetical protein